MADTIFSISLGIGLAAACGFRVFTPMLIAGLAARAEYLTLADGFDWIGSWPAITVFVVATVLEIGAYYVPWLDNGLDSAAAPAAVIAGVIVAAACVHDLHPLLKWSLAAIAGGGSAGTIKMGLAGIRLASTTFTGGGANFLVSTGEWLAAVAMSILSMLLPVLAAIVAIVLVAVLLRFAVRLWYSFSQGPSPQPADVGDQ